MDKVRLYNKEQKRLPVLNEVLAGRPMGQEQPLSQATNSPDQSAATSPSFNRQLIASMYSSD
jgi:hypothetical protein